jgi:hypothetical protein
MPILTITLKGEELKQKTVNLHAPLNLRYFKLLHVNHNITSVDLNAARQTVAPADGAVTGTAAGLALMFAQVSFLTTKDVTFYETRGNEAYNHNVFSVGETTDDAGKIDFKELFKMLTTRPTQVHQPFTIQLYAYDTSVETAGGGGGGDDFTLAGSTHYNQLRAVSQMVSSTLPDDKFMTLTFEYDEYDRVPRTH